MRLVFTLIFLILQPQNSFASDGSSQGYRDDFSKAWLDLLPLDHYFGPDSLLPSTTRTPHTPLLPIKGELIGLYKAIKDYHLISKTLSHLVADRIERLRAIARLSVKIRKVPECRLTHQQDRILEMIIVRCNLKAQYLLKIVGITYEVIKQASSFEKESTPYVRTKLHVIRHLDPEHREGLEDLLNEWDKLPISEQRNTPFFMWLENKDTRHLTQDLRYFFLTMNQKKVEFRDGVAFNAIFRSRETFKPKVIDGRYVYNISTEGDLYILPAFETRERFLKERPELFKMPTKSAGHDQLKKPLNHDNILDQKTVWAAGIVEFKGGKIVKIDAKSGHYRPKMLKHLRPALIALNKKYPGAISDNVVIGTHSRRLKVSYRQLLNAQPGDFGGK